MASSNSSNWTFLSHHAHVLLCLAAQPDLRLREIAERVGITERAVFSIVNDLEAGGYLTRIREGRRNRYQLNPDGPLRHPLERPHTVGALLNALATITEKA